MLIRSVVVEGGDLIGKTTLCRELAERNGWKIERKVKVKNDLDFMMELFDDLHRCQSRSHRGISMTTVYDRHPFISNMVYGGLTDETTRRVQFAEQHNILKEYGILLVFLLGSPNIIRERYAVRGDAFVSVEEAVRGNDQYWKISNTLKSLFGDNVLLIDATAEPLDAIVTHIENIIKGENV